MNPEITQKAVRHNFIVGMLDGSFFGLALGFASVVTVLPLFVSHLTDSALLIGLIPAIRTVGWQLPQLFTIQHISRLDRYRPMVLAMAIVERLPFLGLVMLAWFLPQLARELALALTFGLLICQGLGGGLAAAPWQNLIGKVIPPDRLGTFFGGQAALGYLTNAIGAIVAGLILSQWTFPMNFAACFLLAFGATAFSWVVLANTSERAIAPARPSHGAESLWRDLGTILKFDVTFRWYMAARVLAQLSTMAFTFYIIYAVRRYGMNEAVAGVMTAVFRGAQIAANPLLGWVADRSGPRVVMQVGVLAAAGSALMAWLAPALEWFYVVFALAGVANVVIWTLSLAMTLSYSPADERPAYIGLSNAVVAPATILAPLAGGWLADNLGFATTFLVSAASGLITALVVQQTLSNPRRPAQAAPGLAGCD